MVQAESQARLTTGEIRTAVMRPSIEGAYSDVSDVILRRRSEAGRQGPADFGAFDGGLCQDAIRWLPAFAVRLG